MCLFKKYLTVIFLIIACTLQAQEKTKHTYFQVDLFHGNILKHNKNVGHFLNDHPTGFFLSYNFKTTGKEDWQQRYNYPDFGISGGFQDYKNPILGKLYSLYAHYNFYLNKRENPNHIILRTGWGAAFNTNPYNKVTNPKNVAFGSKLNSSTYFKLYYQRNNLIKQVGINAGLTFVHASNSSVKSPNTGVNVWAATVGLNYDFNNTKIEFTPKKEKEKFTEPIKYNFVFRFGANETDYIGSGIKPFFVLSAYADKRLNYKSAIQFGGEFMVNYSLKDYIDISAIQDQNYEKGDFKRASLLVGHELFISKVSLITQLGYYVYYPVKFEGRIYERLGFNYYFNDKWFASISLKAHAAKAETVAFGIGIRL